MFEAVAIVGTHAHVGVHIESIVTTWK